jgi:hypothetical protein
MLLSKIYNGGEKLSWMDRCKLFIGHLTPDFFRDRDGRSIEKILDREVLRLFQDQDFVTKIQGEDQNRRIFSVTSRLANRMIFILSERLLKKKPGEQGLLELFNNLSALGLIHLLTAPYYLAFHHQHRGKEIMTDLVNRFDLAVGGEGSKTAVFTDDLAGFRKGLNLRPRFSKTGMNMVLTSSEHENGALEGGVNFQSVGQLAMPGHPKLRLHFPPILDIIDYFEKEGFQHIHLHTPGTMGLVGVLISKLLNVPFTAECHHDYPHLVRSLTRDEGLENLSWTYLAVVFNQAEGVEVSSGKIRDRLIQGGLSPEKFNHSFKKAVGFE